MAFPYLISPGRCAILADWCELGVISWLGPECVFKRKYPVYPGNRHQAVMSDQFIAIRVLNKRCDFCASAVWLYSCRSVWHAKMIFIQLSKYQSTFKISVNFVKYISQLSKYGATFSNISHSSGRMYILWEHV